MKMSLFIAIGCFFSLVFSVYGESPPCPPVKDIYPCYCTNDQYLTSVGCEGLSSLDKAYSAIKNTRGQNMSFAFRKSRLGDIPSDFFEGHQSINLHFEECQIGSFGSRPFSGLENTLKDLFIYGSVNKRRKDLETFPLGHLKKLDSLAFQANDIKKLGNDWFKDGPESLEYLNLEANDIEELGNEAFASLVNVEQIWLGDNSFKKVSRSMFPRPANKLQLLEMSFSGYSELPEDMFKDMPALKRVIVSGNKLQTIPEATWGRIWDQLDEVYLERNAGFICDERIKWIYQRKLPKILTGRCPASDNSKLSGKELSSLKLSDFE